jgi:hypothetical protein
VFTSLSKRNKCKIKAMKFPTSSRGVKGRYGIGNGILQEPAI